MNCKEIILNFIEKQNLIFIIRNDEWVIISDKKPGPGYNKISQHDEFISAFRKDDERKTKFFMKDYDKCLKS